MAPADPLGVEEATLGRRIRAFTARNDTGRLRPEDFDMQSSQAAEIQLAAYLY